MCIRDRLSVNPKTGAINKIQTYSTVAHEGFPGHMFQYSFMYENQQNLFRNACIDVYKRQALSLGACSSKDPQEEQKKFDRFIEKQFIQQMESDYTTMHVYLKQPQKHGVDPTNVKVNLGERPTIENQHKAAEKAKKVWDEFKEFKRDILSDEQKQTYDCFEYQGNIELQLMDKKFDYYQQMFASISGIHYQMPTLFSDWDLRNEQDVKDLILLVKDVKPYVCLLYTS